RAWAMAFVRDPAREHLGGAAEHAALLGVLEDPAVLVAGEEHHDLGRRVRGRRRARRGAGREAEASDRGDRRDDGGAYLHPPIRCTNGTMRSTNAALWKRSNSAHVQSVRGSFTRSMKITPSR